VALINPIPRERAPTQTAPRPPSIIQDGALTARGGDPPVVVSRQRQKIDLMASLLLPCRSASPPSDNRGVQIPPRTHYLHRDGPSLAYQVFGDGPPLVVAPSVPSHLDLMWVDPSYSQVLRRLGSFARVLLFDPRGAGLSDPVDHVPTLEEAADDIEAVMDAAGLGRAVIWATVSTCPSAALFAARAPDRVQGLVLLMPYAQGSRAGGGPDSIVGWDERMAKSMAAWDEAIEHHWGEGRTLAIAAPGLGGERLRRSWGMLERASASPAMIRAITQAAEEADTREVLRAIQAPTIVLAPRDGYQPEAIPRHVAELVPNSEFHLLPAPSEADGLESFFSPVVDHIERVVTGGHTARPADRILATMMFTDIVGSTVRASELGDSRWRVLLDHHDELVRDHVEAAGGRVVKTTGDGSLCIFDGPARAIRCGQAIAGAVRDLGVEVRVGLHTAECEVVDNDLAGVAVHIAARVCAAAAAGEVMVSRTVRDLVAGSGLELQGRGEHELKGVSGKWELFALAGGESDAIQVEPEAPPTQPADRIVLATARRTPGLLRLVGRIYSRG
jgi:class 3 adenylate cyclase/pimeloyl-ACP methyl ester carboxylesterase